MGGLIKIQILHPTSKDLVWYVWPQALRSAFLTSNQVILRAHALWKALQYFSLRGSSWHREKNLKKIYAGKLTHRGPCWALKPMNPGRGVQDTAPLDGRFCHENDEWIWASVGWTLATSREGIFGICYLGLGQGSVPARQLLGQSGDDPYPEEKESPFWVKCIWGRCFHRQCFFMPYYNLFNWLGVIIFPIYKWK